MIFNKIKEQGRTLVGSFMLALVLIMSSGCSKKESTIGGAAIGAGTGVAIGAAAGGTGGAIAGGLIGAGLGGIIGNSAGKRCHKHTRGAHDVQRCGAHHCGKNHCESRSSKE